MLSVFKKIKSDCCFLPSLFSQHTMDGVTSRLGVDESKPPTYNGASIDDMRGNPIFDRVDQIDRKGLVERQLEKHVKDFAKSDYRRAFYHALQSSPKPSNY